MQKCRKYNCVLCGRKDMPLPWMFQWRLELWQNSQKKWRPDSAKYIENFLKLKGNQKICHFCCASINRWVWKTFSSFRIPITVNCGWHDTLFEIRDNEKMIWKLGCVHALASVLETKTKEKEYAG